MDYMSLTEKSDLKMDLKILSISCKPSDVLVKFQGRYISDCEFDYHILQKEIQLVPKETEDISIGEFCLVQDKPLGVWHRGKILDKVKRTFEVALIDLGNVVKVALPQVASATGELFSLPPKVVNGIFSNLLPLEEKWNSRAANYFSSLVGEQLNGHVKTFLPHQVILLEIQKVISHAIELNLAKYMDSDSFCLLVEILHKVPANSHCKQMPDLLPQKKLSSDISLSLNDSLPRFQKILDHLRPDICADTMEKVKISAAVSPDRFYCRIWSWEVEFNKLTASMCSHYEAVKAEESSTLGSFGVLCAAKRKDGLWGRGVIQTLISCNEVKVWFMDVGSSETVSSSYVQKLQPEFLSLPMMAIPCALSRANDHVESVKNTQLVLFKEALLGHIVIALLNNFCSEERLFYIFLYDNAYEFNANCHLTNKKIPIFSPNSYTDLMKAECDAKSESIDLPSTALEQDETISYKSIQMDLESVHVAYVEYVLNPSNFWIRTDECQNEFSTMMDKIAEQYNKCELMEMVLQDPKPGQFCCALYAKDRHYYRAVITEVLYPQISVYFIDFGNTETIPFYDVKVLLPHFSAMPALAMCCTLAYAYPPDDVWVKSANDFFKQTVSGKALLCHVLTKQKYKYVVEMRLLENSDSSDIVSLMVQAGYAEFWKVNLRPISLNPEYSSRGNGTEHKRKASTCTSPIAVENYRLRSDKKIATGTWTLKLKPTEQMSSLCAPLSNFLEPILSPVCYKQYIFKPGVLMDVKCSHVESPRNFWCQLPGNLSKLNTLMDEIQRFYVSCCSRYQHGHIACVAKSSYTGKYYRAAVLKHVSRNEVNVIFIDYGNIERVLASGLREIKPQFLKLEGQAFRCCLSKVFSLSYTQHEWSANACEDFKTMLDSTPDVMKCTIVALFSRCSEDLSNAVNLETPLGNANQLLASKGHLVLRGTVPSVHLHTFCYSSFDLETGSEEEVYVTFVFSTGKFYCQLAKNEKMFDILMKKVSKIGEQVQPETTTQELYIVKYFQDGNFYRALTCPVESSSLFIAFFVDFGDSQMVKKSELLPIPEEATDILFQPMQAIPCYLSGLKEALLTTEAKAWFEEQCVGKLVNAVVVSRDHEGQLELELYSGNVSIHDKIKRLLGMDSPQENPKEVANSSNAKLVIAGDDGTIEDKRKIPESDCHKGGKRCQTMPSSDLNGNEVPLQHVKSVSDNPRETLLKISLQKKALKLGRDPAKSKGANHAMNSSLSPPNRGKLVKCIDLPEVFLEAGHSYSVYASHVNNPSNFYLHLAKNETLIMQIVEELNDMSFQSINVKDLEQGVLVVAQYPEDEAFYRAEIKEILQDHSFQVEFIDYGNAARVDSSGIFKLPEKFINIPKLSVSVSLTGVQKLQNRGEWSKDVTEKFFHKVTSEPVNCKFLCKHDTQWEVDITCNGQSVSEELLGSFQTAPKQSAVAKKDCLSKSDLSYFHLSSKMTKEEVIKPTTSKIIHKRSSLKLEPGQIEKVKHTYVSDCGMLFVNLANYSEAPKINLHISSAVKQAHNRIVAKDISVGMICLAKSDKMQTWFRASIEKFFPNAMKVAVFFVDHGASEIISVHNTKRLSAAALSIPKQAVACKWAWAEKNGQNVFKTLLHYIWQKEVEVLFLEFLESINAWKVEILVNGLSLMQYVNTTFHHAEKNWSGAESHCHFESKIVSSIPRGSLKLLEVCPGFVTSFHNPSNFFVQLGNSIDTMNTLSQLMQRLPDNLSPLAVDSLRPGSPCLVECFAEKEWCRAEIVSINIYSILLYVLDFGVYKHIPYSDYGKLKGVSEELVSLPALTYHCTLHGVIPEDGKCWSKAAIRYFIHFVQNRDLIILPVKNKGMNVTEVSIYGEGNLSRNLVSKGFALNSEQRGISAEDIVKTDMSAYSFNPLKHTKHNLQDVYCSENPTYIDFSSLKAKWDPTEQKENDKHYISEEFKLDCKAGFPLYKSC